jgi:probable rRNA maturation factor
MAAVNFFTEDIDFKVAHPRKTSAWITKIVKKEKAALASVNFIFCSDRYLLGLNAKHLNHKTLTDIITFDYSTSRKSIEGDVFISIERVRENSVKFRKTFDDELHRVLIHGVLHLLGYDDNTPKAKSSIHEKEDICLSLR